MNRIRILLALSVSLLFAAGAVSAQSLEELCPNSNGTGALVGIVSDTDAQMALPGAAVQATWDDEGIPGRAETHTGLDGGFTMCYLPIGTEVSVQAVLGTMAGQALALTLAEPITRQDVGFSLTGGSGGADYGEEKIWACIGPPDSQMRVQLGSLVRCDSQWPSLDRCPKEELGKVSASGGGGRRRGAMREMVDQLVDQARRLGANALVDFSGGRGSFEAIAVKIDVDPSTC